MKKLPTIPIIPESEQTPVVKALLVLIEQLLELAQEQAEAIDCLKDEISILKGEKRRPKFKPSRLDEETDKAADDEDKQGKGGKRPGSAKRSKTAKLTVHETRIVSPNEAIPEGSRFKGYKDFVVQELLISNCNTRYRLERWITPDGHLVTGQLPACLNGRHFGPELIRYVLYQYHHCHVTQPLLVEQLHEWGIDISTGQVNELLTNHKDCFHTEKAMILQEGLRAASYVTVDDSGARHDGKNGYVTQIGSPLFAWFMSTQTKNRINFLTCLQGGEPRYAVNASAFEYFRHHGLPLSVMRALRCRSTDPLSASSDWEALLDERAITKRRHRQLATEGALLGGVLSRDMNQSLAIISDDAGQFNVLTHGLCWVHAERLVYKMIPLNEDHREDLKQVRSQIWALYAELKAYKQAPSASKKMALSEQFDIIFTQKTRYITLNKLLTRLHANKAELLLVLERPEVPLHTNDSERDLRDYVKKRKISAGTRSDEGRRCRDTFASLKKTCRKLGISFWQYLIDRVSNNKQGISLLHDIIRQRASLPS